ncbi:MAG: DDE-type integrase/transposase/recombinase [Gemmatimonadaceae bacterium]|nr:DDE-type integrase/transposase/recombinase [Gloeobacterales cyanobacterium ES-bin-141]
MIFTIKAEQALLESCVLRQVNYLNNLVEQDHRSIKRLTRPGLGFQKLRTAWRTIRGYEVMNMIRKGQIIGVEKGAIQSQVKFIEDMFGLAA